MLSWNPLSMAQSSQINPTNGCINCNTSTASSAVFELQSTSKGLLVPRMTTTQRNAIVNPAKGLLVFTIDTNVFWYFNGTEWTTTQGPQGLQGKIGTQGPAGATGATGLKGDTGATGANGTNGTNGATGATGATGLKGDTGAAGANGTNGTNGATGATGATGLKGDTGAAGANGANGATGAQGPPGISCWDLNSNGIGDGAEDTNGDNLYNVLDCQASSGSLHTPELENMLIDGEHLDKIIPLISSVHKLKKEKDEEINTLKGLINQQQKGLKQQQEQIQELTTLIQTLVNHKEITDKVTIHELKLGKVAFLAQNFPNPFQEQTTLNYFVPEQVQQAIIQITNSSGAVLGKVTIQDKGKGQVVIDTGDLSTGNYYYSLVLDGQLFETKQMVLTR